MKDPVSFIRWMSQSIHNEHHEGPWDGCMEQTCVSAKMWIEDFRRDEPVWITADKKIIPVMEMEDAHLINSYRMIKKKIAKVLYEAKSLGLDDLRAKDVVEAEFPIFSKLKAEIIRRETIKIKQYDGTRNLDI